MRRLSLTPDHIAKIHHPMEDPGPPPGMVLHDDADYDLWVENMLSSHPAPDHPTRIFAYGSLIWRPEIEHVGEEIGTARGWHRSFCFRIPRFRGTPEWPGLMMALDRGGQCRGMVFELPADDLAGQFGRLFRREFTTKPANSMPRWITVETEAGSGPALAFVMNRQSPAYAGRLEPQDVATILSRACGHWGTGAEYLMNTVSHLEERGIHDRNLWRLQKLVAARIEAAG